VSKTNMISKFNCFTCSQWC